MESKTGADAKREQLIQRLRQEREERQFGKSKTQQARAGSYTGSLFKLYNAKKNIYAIKIQNYMCEMIKTPPPPGELGRFFQHFKDKFSLGRNMIYPSLPAMSLLEFQSLADRQALIALIDAQDENGWTALHWAVYHVNTPLVKSLLANGASTEIETFVNRDKPIDKSVTRSVASVSQIHELFRKYKEIRANNSARNGTKKATTKQSTSEITGDTSPFPFLDLPIELQTLILEQFTIGALLRVRCVCKYLQTLYISNKHVIDLPEMGIFQFVDPPVDTTWHRKNSPQCQLTVMATPTVFHFGLIFGKHYKVPTVTGIDTFIYELTERIERFATEDKKFKYDINKMKEFLLTSWLNNQRFYIIEANNYAGLHVVYVELDSSFGVGIEFKSPYDPPPPNDDDW